MQKVRESSVPDKKNPSSLSIIFSNKEVLITTICLSLIKLAFYAFYYGAMGCLERTGFNFGASLFVLSVGEFLGYWSCEKLADKFERKTLLICSNLAKSLLGLTFMLSFVHNSDVLSSIVLSLTFFFGAYNFSAITII